MRVSVGRASKETKIARNTIYKHIRAGKLQTFTEGRKTLIELDELNALIEANRPRREKLATKSKRPIKKPRLASKPTHESVVSDSQPSASREASKPTLSLVEEGIAERATKKDGERERFVTFWRKRFGSFFTTLDDLAKAALDGGFIQSERDIKNFLRSQTGENDGEWQIKEYRGDFILGRVIDDSLEVKPDIVTDFPRVQRALETNTPPRPESWSDVEEAEYIRLLRERGANTVDEINRLPSDDETKRIAETLKGIPPMRNPFTTAEDDDFADVLTSGDEGVISELKSALERGGNRALIFHAVETHFRCEPRMRRTLIKCLRSV